MITRAGDYVVASLIRAFGRVIMEGASPELLGHPKVKEAYPGMQLDPSERPYDTPPRSGICAKGR
jgi:hypothetical protein